MIGPAWRLWAGSGSLMNGGPYTWHITDFDQRRHFSVTYCPSSPVEDSEGTEDVCMAMLRRHIDDLGPEVLGLRFSDPDGPITTSTDRNDDVTYYNNCQPLSALKIPFSIKTVSLSSLVEIGRMGPQVDLVSYQGHPTVNGVTVTKVAFKYWFMENGMFRKWYELQCWARLPRDHPHIVPFDAVVLDDIRGGVVGFTSLFISGGTLWDNNATIRPFRLQWLQQLLSVIDDLNYHYGIMHQDVAARNLLIDDKEDLHRDDMKGVIFTLYEIITLDEHFREVPHEEQDAEALLRLEWVKHPDVRLDSSVQAFREVLDAWVAKRRTREFSVVDTCIHWPWMPEEPPSARVPVYGSSDAASPATETRSVAVLSRRALLKMNEPFFNWERPASYRLKDMPEKSGAK
ncbi:kinase-like domain [Cordyceps militaris]|uniref:non-specific serine/threonine protein kinase n=1 Tax=Cordyceps militaris TaxID=73501 RepID=A0A2H4SSN7_CORMI|nr:kinase-like domain [Cordyceps militaris]